MDKWNGSLVTEFFLVGLSEDHTTQIILFVLFLHMYIATVLGNAFLITACVLEPHLHTPMYFFLANLSFIDISYSLAVVPNLLNQLLASRKMSFSGCAAQMYSCLFLGGTECMLLAVMAYDRYVAILFPLRYTTIINKSACHILAGSCWASGCLVALLDTVFTLQLPLCGNNVIDHFFFEATTFIKMACADAFIAKMVIFSVGVFVLLMPCILTFLSYIHIILTIAGIHSSEGRYKAFSTCASHLIVVIIFYGTAIFTYMKPVSKDSASLEKMVSVFYTVTPPMMNPIIYSMRNKDVKMALKKVLWKTIQP